jgi:hypothetical protein
MSRKHQASSLRAITLSPTCLLTNKQAMSYNIAIWYNIDVETLDEAEKVAYKIQAKADEMAGDKIMRIPDIDFYEANT